MNRLAGGDEPVPAPARGQPGRLVPVGRGGASPRAGGEDKPILLSVGYSACHWCHVMERESFEDDEIARADERALRQRSRSTARSGPTSTRSTWTRSCALTRAGRLADDGVPDARRRAVLRRHVLPARAAVRHAELPRGAHGRSPRAGASERERDRRGRAGALAEHLRSARAQVDAVGRRRPRIAAVLADGGRRPDDGVRRASGAAGAARRSSRPRRRSSSCSCAAGERETGRRGRSTGWRRAACTTTSAAASTATRSTSAGSCRTSRRCSTTTRSSPSPTSTATSRSATSGTARVAERRSSTCCASCRSRAAASPRRRTPTPTASRGSPSRGRPGGRARRAARAVRGRPVRAPRRARRRDAGAALRAPRAPAQAAARRQGDRVLERARSRRPRRVRAFLDRPDWVDAARRLAEFLLGPLSTADGRLHRTWRDGVAQGNRLPRGLRERRERALRAARRDRRAALARGVAPPAPGSRSSCSPTRRRRLLPDAVDGEQLVVRRRRTSTTTRRRAATRCSPTCSCGSPGSTATTSSRSALRPSSGSSRRPIAGRRRRSAGRSSRSTSTSSPRRELAIVGPVRLGRWRARRSRAGTRPRSSRSGRRRTCRCSRARRSSTAGRPSTSVRAVRLPRARQSSRPSS